MDLDITFGLQLLLLCLLTWSMGPLVFNPLLAALNRREEALEQLPIQTEHLRKTYAQRQAALQRLQQQGQQTWLAAELEARAQREQLVKTTQQAARKASHALLQQGRQERRTQVEQMSANLASQVGQMEQVLLSRCLPQGLDPAQDKPGKDKPGKGSKQKGRA